MAMPKAEQRARNLEAQKRCRARKAEKKRKRKAASKAASNRSNARRDLATLLKRAEKFAAAAVAKDAEASRAQVDECPICLEELDDASPSLACDHRFHAACLQELAAAAWAEGAARTRARGTAVLCPCCRGQSYVK